MSFLRRLTWFVLWAVLAAPGVLLVLEGVEVIDDRWRRELAAGLEQTAFPGWPAWASALAGIGLAAAGVLLIVAQLAPPRKGLNTMHEVHADRDGETNLRGRAAISAVRHEVEAIEGVVEVEARITGKTMHVELKIDDRANIAELEAQARERLGHPFWIDLGLADFAVDLLVTHHPKPPRVR